MFGYTDITVLNVAALSNYVTAPNSAVPKVMYGISYNGQQINVQT